MLLINDEKVKLTKEQLDMIKKITGGKWPVMFRYIDSLYQPNKLNNNKADFPRSVSIPTTTPVIDPETKDQYFLKYYENSVRRPDGSGKTIEVFNPTNINVDERIVVNETQKDLFWFLWNNKLNASGPSAKLAKKHYFHLENLEQEADKFVTEKGLELSVGFAIMSNEGMPEEQLRLVAGAYYITNADTDELSIVRKKLYNLIFLPEKRTGKPNPETLKNFNRDVKSDKTISLKSKIQRAVDLGIIKYKNEKKKWFWMDDEGNATQSICAAVNPMKAQLELFEYLNLKDKAKEAKEFMDEVDKVYKQKKAAVPA